MIDNNHWSYNSVSNTPAYASPYTSSSYSSVTNNVISSQTYQTPNEFYASSNSSYYNSYHQSYQGFMSDSSSLSYTTSYEPLEKTCIVGQLNKASLNQINKQTRKSAKSVKNESKSDLTKKVNLKDKGKLKINYRIKAGIII
jgi:hypothetical protein